MAENVTNKEIIEHIQKQLIASEPKLASNQEELEKRTGMELWNFFKNGTIDRWELASIMLTMGLRVKPEVLLEKHSMSQRDKNPWEETISVEDIMERTQILVLTSLEDNLGTILYYQFGLANGSKRYSLKQLSEKYGVSIGAIRTKSEKAQNELYHSQAFELISTWIDRADDNFRSQLTENFDLFFAQIYSFARR